VRLCYQFTKESADCNLQFIYSLHLATERALTRAGRKPSLPAQRSGVCSTAHTCPESRKEGARPPTDAAEQSVQRQGGPQAPALVPPHLCRRSLRAAPQAPPLGSLPGAVCASDTALIPHSRRRRPANWSLPGGPLRCRAEQLPRYSNEIALRLHCTAACSPRGCRPPPRSDLAGRAVVHVGAVQLLPGAHERAAALQVRARLHAARRDERRQRLLPPHHLRRQPRRRQTPALDR